MSDIKELYKEIILNGFYDEEYGSKPEIIEGKKHGVCIDFSRELIKKLKENGYLAGLISTLNSDGFLHAAVAYKNLENGETFIADPVTDVRKVTKLNDEERTNIIEQILSTENWKRTIEQYIEEFGVITAYSDNMQQCMKNIQDREEFEAIPTINNEIDKKFQSCQTLSGLANVKNVADGPTLLACQTLYKKGIDTYCSNYTPNGDVSINVDFNSLSEENKQILLELRENNPENYFIMNRSGFYGSLGHNTEQISEDKPMELVFGFKSTQDKATPEINLQMNELISKLKKQTYMYGVYSREDVLNNKPNKMNPMSQLMGQIEDIQSTEQDTNEQIAVNEELLYSNKYNLFFRNQRIKSRYMESLYRKEHDLRDGDQIAKEAGIVHDSETGMFFENEQELNTYKENIRISSSDIVKADMERKTSQTLIDNIKNFFERCKNRIFNKGER